MGVFDPAIFDADVFDVVDAEGIFTGPGCLYNVSTHSRIEPFGKTTRAVIIDTGHTTAEFIDHV